MWFQRKRSRVCPRVRGGFASSNRCVVSHWAELFGGHLREQSYICHSVQEMHQGFGFFLFLRAINRAARDALGTLDISLW